MSLLQHLSSSKPLQPLLLPDVKAQNKFCNGFPECSLGQLYCLYYTCLTPRNQCDICCFYCNVRTCSNCNSNISLFKGWGIIPSPTIANVLPSLCIFLTIDILALGRSSEYTMSIFTFSAIALVDFLLA